MKTKVYKKILEKNRVILYEKIILDIPIYKIIKNKIYSDNVFGEDFFIYEYISRLMSREWDNCFGFLNTNDNHNNFSGEKKLIPLKTKTGCKFLNGIIGYYNLEQLVEFLYKNIDLKASTPLSEYILSCKDIHGKLDKNMLYEKLQRDINHYNKLFNFFINLNENNKFFRRHDRRRYYILENNVMFFSNDYDRIEQCIFVIEKKMDIRGYKIPYVNYIYHESSTEGGFHNKDLEIHKNTLFYVEGKIGVCENITDLNPGLITEFDKKGAFYSSTCVDLLPDDSRELFAILRVPTKKEFQAFKKTGNKQANNRILENAFYLEPSYRPMKMPPNIDVIDDIEVFNHIVSKMAMGIYLPRNLSFDFDVNLLQDKEQFVFLTKPV